MWLPPDPFAEIEQGRRAFAAFLAAGPAVREEAAKRPGRGQRGEVAVRVSCGRCGRVLDELRLSGDGQLRRVGRGRAHVAHIAAAPGSGVRAQALADRWRYRCHRRCGAEHVVGWARLQAAAARVAAHERAADRVILLPGDLYG